MTPPTLRAIKCSERMPKQVDANDSHFVVWLNERDGFMYATQYNRKPHWATHFFPLNRSAIATDAEEQT